MPTLDEYGESIAREIVAAAARQYFAERRFFGNEEATFTTADQYVARLLDLVDLLGGAYRLASLTAARA